MDEGRPAPGEATADGREVEVLTADGAVAEISLHGATVVGYRPGRHEPVLFTSARALFADGEPIRGGIPLCFPWFGPHPTGDGPNHGRARTARWHVAAEERSHGASRLVLRPDDGAAALVGGAADVRLEVSLGATLDVALVVEAADDLQFTAALHTYLVVSDPRTVTVAPLAGSIYRDKLAGTDEIQDRDLTPEPPLDRVYRTAPEVTLTDPGLDRVLTLTPRGATDTVVWNPGAEQAATIGDLGDDEWLGFLCVEAAVVAPHLVRVAAGHHHEIGVTIAATRP